MVSIEVNHFELKLSLWRLIIFSAKFLVLEQPFVLGLICIGLNRICWLGPGLLHIIDRLAYFCELPETLFIFLKSVFDLLVLFDSLKVFLSLICKIAFKTRKGTLQVNIIDIYLVHLPFQQVTIGHVIFTGFIIDAPLSPFVVEIIDTVSVVTNERVDMVLAVDGDAHDLLGGVDLLEGHSYMNDRWIAICI